MPTGAKHGSILPVTEQEYEEIMEKWGKDLVIPVTLNDDEKRFLNRSISLILLEGNTIKKHRYFG